MQLLGAAVKCEHLFGLGRQVFDLCGQTCQRLLQADELISVFFQEFAPVLERESSVALGQEREEKSRTLAKTFDRAGELRGVHAVALQRGLYIAAKLFQ